MKLSLLRSAIVLLLVIPTLYSFAQPTLPEVGAATEKGINILSWTNPYTNGLKSISVQRSADSTFNFTTIGVVSDLSKPVQNFVDAHPMPGKNYYRLTLTFSSDVTWKSNTILLGVDSMAIANQQALPPNDTLQKIISQMGSAGIEKLNTISYAKSQYVFTNPFTGNINIEVPEPFVQNYYILFYDQGDKQVLKIPRINDKVVVLDKRNFQKSGIFKFKLFKNGEEFEKGFVTIY